jgi:hypothetical protein
MCMKLLFNSSTRVKKILRFSIFFVLVIFIFSNCSYAQKVDSTISLFDGSTLNGWKTVKSDNDKYWKVVEGVITGGDGLKNIPSNTYLHTTQTFEDFELRFLFRISGRHEHDLINSGVQYRSIIEGNNIVGYQADIGKGYWGDIYDEHRRAKLVGGNLNILKHILNEEGWNSYIVRSKGNKHDLYINGVKVSEYIEKDPDIPSKGVIGFQLHSGGNTKVEFKYITITTL